MGNILEYKCPCCGGAISFDSKLQKLKCPFCDTEFEVDTLEQYEEHKLDQDVDPDWDADHIEDSTDEFKDDAFASYVCESCGGEIIAEKTMGASSCPYCGNPVIVMKQFGGMIKPEMVIPFKLDKKDAEQKLKEHLQGKILLPGLFRTENRIKEVKGLYVPFWLFDADADADIQYKATKLRTWTTGSYRYEETSHYMIKRAGNISFEKVPADGSKKMDDELMESIEPFHYDEAVPFKTAYLAGYMADRYDVSSEERSIRANERMRESTISKFRDTVTGYDTVTADHTNISLNQGKIYYALLPVWVLSTQYKGKIFTFAMNGQTGKFIGDLPWDRRKAVTIGSAVFAGATVLAKIILGLFL